MFEKVNPSHPDKVADRIAGALVDFAYSVQDDPKIAVEVLLGHGTANLVVETSVSKGQIMEVVPGIIERIVGEPTDLRLVTVSQDEHLASNQAGAIRCGDNGIFRGVPVTGEQASLTKIARELYSVYGSDGKYILDGERLILCQSRADEGFLETVYPGAVVNPLGFWTGGVNVDAGATNRKLGSDMGDAVTGGGLHGKDLSKCDVSVNIYAHMLAQSKGEPVEFSCAIGDEFVGGRPYREIVEQAREYVRGLGGFEALAEWGLIR